MPPSRAHKYEQHDEDGGMKYHTYATSPLKIIAGAMTVMISEETLKRAIFPTVRELKSTKLFILQKLNKPQSLRFLLAYINLSNIPFSFLMPPQSINSPS